MKALIVLTVCLGVVCTTCISEAVEKPSDDPMSTPVTVELKDSPLETAVAMLFMGTGKSFVFDSGVDRKMIIPNLSLKDITLDQAVKTITRSAGLTYRRDGTNIYLIMPKNQTPQNAEGPYQGIAETGKDAGSYGIADTDSRMVEKMALNYIDCQDIATLFGATSFTSRGTALVTGGNSIGNNQYNSGRTVPVSDNNRGVPFNSGTGANQNQYMPVMMQSQR